jgi:hypothetical protein
MNTIKTTLSFIKKTAATENTVPKYKNIKVIKNLGPIDRSIDVLTTNSRLLKHRNPKFYLEGPLKKLGLDGKSAVNGSPIKNVMIIGPGYSAVEIEDFIECLPYLKAIHLIDINDSVCKSIDKELEKYKSTSRFSLPKIFFYNTGMTQLPKILYKKIDLAYACNVFEFSSMLPRYGELFFHDPGLEKTVKGIVGVLKPGGIHISVALLEAEALLAADPSMEPVMHWGPLLIGKESCKDFEDYLDAYIARHCLDFQPFAPAGTFTFASKYSFVFSVSRKR